MKASVTSCKDKHHGAAYGRPAKCNTTKPGLMKEGIGFGSPRYRCTWFDVPRSDCCLLISLQLYISIYYTYRKCPLGPGYPKTWKDSLSAKSNNNLSFNLQVCVSGIAIANNLTRSINLSATYKRTKILPLPFLDIKYQLQDIYHCVWYVYICTYSYLQ